MNKDLVVRLPGMDHEIKLSVYWSELVRATVAPTTYSLRIALGINASVEVPNVRAVIQGSSVRDAILAGCNP